MATAANIAKFEAQRHELEAKAGQELAAAQARALKFENFKLELKAKAGAEGKLFGSIGTADIAEAAVKAGQPISRSEVRMPTGPIRVTGDHQVQLHLHTDVNVTLRSQSSPKSSGRLASPTGYACPLASSIEPWAPATALRLPPHSIEAEQSVLGGLMLDATAWDQIADRVTSEDFYRNDHRLIFEAVAVLIERTQPCDAVTLSGHLESRGLLDQVGGLSYLGSLARDTPTTANIRAYADIVRERSVLRQLIAAGNLIVGTALEPEGREAREVVDEAERAVFEIAERGSRGKVGFRTVKSILPDVVNRIDELYHSDGKMTGVSTGFKKLDEMTSGMQAGDLIIIAGRPSMGKTTLAVNIAENAALGSNKSCAIFSMEMSAESLTLRMISSLGRINQSHLRSGRLEEQDWPRIDSAMTQLGNANIFVDETPGLTPTEIRARARRLKRERGLDLIVVDYLQLMQVAGTKENRATEISEISRSLKALAKELKVPVIALSQLNRGVEQRVEKKPVMSDLRESVTGETLVCLADGRRVPIRDLVGQTPEVWAMSEDQKIIKAQSDLVWSKGVRQVFRVALASGRSLRATLQPPGFYGRWVEDCR